MSEFLLVSNRNGLSIHSHEETLGTEESPKLGLLLGTPEGVEDGPPLGADDGLDDGEVLGDELGFADTVLLGCDDGNALGIDDFSSLGN